MFFKRKEDSEGQKPADVYHKVEMPANPMQEAKKPETIRALLLPVGEPPVCIDIKNDNEIFRLYVNGPTSSDFIDMATRDALLIMNDLAKVWKLPLNRYIYDGKDILCGQAIVVGFDYETHRVCSLSDEAVKKYKKLFEMPIVGAEAEILGPIVEKTSKLTVVDQDSKKVATFTLDDMRKNLENGEIGKIGDGKNH